MLHVYHVSCLTCYTCPVVHAIRVLWYMLHVPCNNVSHVRVVCCVNVLHVSCDTRILCCVSVLHVSYVNMLHVQHVAGGRGGV